MLAFQSVMAGSTSGAGPPELPRHLAARIVVQAKDMEDKQRTAALFATEDHLLAFYRTSDKAAVCKVARIDKSTFQFGPALALVQLLEAAGGLAADAEPSTLTVLSNALHLMLEAAAADMLYGLTSVYEANQLLANRSTEAGRDLMQQRRWPPAVCFRFTQQFTFSNEVNVLRSVTVRLHIKLALACGAQLPRPPAAAWCKLNRAELWVGTYIEWCAVRQLLQGRQPL